MINDYHITMALREEIDKLREAISSGLKYRVQFGLSSCNKGRLPF